MSDPKLISTWEDLGRFREWLAGQPASRLVDWLVEAGQLHRPLWIALAAEQARQAAAGAPSPAMRAAIELLSEPPESVTWREASEVGDRASLILPLLTHAMEDGDAAAVVEWAEFALQRIELLSLAVQDSEYWSGSLLGGLREIHRKACRQARPDPIEPGSGG